MQDDNSTFDQCFICYNKYENTDCCTTSCNHKFHTSCLIQWMITSSSCPYCKHTLKQATKNKKEMQDQIELIRPIYEQYMKHVKNFNIFIKINLAIRKSDDNPEKIKLLVTQKQLELYHSQKMKDKMNELLDFVENKIPEYNGKIIYDIDNDNDDDVFDFTIIDRTCIDTIKQFLS